MHYKSFKIYLDNEWVDITNQIDANTEEQARCDKAFEVSTFKVYLTRKKNIAPFTPVEIVDAFDNKRYYWAKSTGYKYLTYPNLYVHDLTLLELGAILEGFILGSKSFSGLGIYNTLREYIVIICELMSNKYKQYKFDYVFNEDFELTQEFILPSGSTMYSALTEICDYINYVVKANSITINDDNTITIHLDFVKLSDNIYYNLDENRILSLNYSQNQDNYCYHLESEANNVIDRTTLTIVDGLTPRASAEEIKISSDTAKIILPNKIESINKMLVQGYDGQVKISFTTNIDLVEGLFSSVYAGASISKTWNEVGDYMGYGFLTNVKNALFKKGFTFDTNQLELYITTNDTTTANWHIQAGNQSSFMQAAYFKFDMSNRVLESNQWNTLPVNEQPKYAYYEEGSYEVQNLHTGYKEDFWNSILGNDVKPLFTHVFADFNYNTLIEGSGWDSYFPNGLDITVDFDMKESPIHYKFDIEYTPIVDMYISSQKQDAPFNELTYSEVARSFDANANFIDFDKLVNAIQNNNDMLGNPDLSIEYYLGQNTNAPRPTQYIVYDDMTWYVSSVITQTSAVSRTCTINLVKDYNTIAEAIGVKTQFESTKNPLDTIIDRIIPIDIDGYGANANFAKFTFYGYNISYDEEGNETRTWSETTLFKRPALLVDEKNNNRYYVVEALDQYSLDTGGTSVLPNINIPWLPAIASDSPYAFSYNEFVDMQVELVRIETDALVMDSTTNLKLPYYDGAYTSYGKSSTISVYKDAREHLIFTLRYKNV